MNDNPDILYKGTKRRCAELRVRNPHLSLRDITKTIKGEGLRIIKTKMYKSAISLICSSLELGVFWVLVL